MPSFDVVSKVDEQEVDNAVNQAQKEMSQRYDFKNSKSEIKWEKKGEITLIGDDDMKLEAVKEMLHTKLAKRGVSLNSLDYGKVEEITGGMKKQVAKIVQGIPQEKAKELVKIIKDTKIKVQAQIQGDQLRVTGKQIDDLQAVMALLREKSAGLPLQFVNMRS